MAALTERGTRPRLDSYITSKQPPDLLSLLPSALILSATPGSSASTYNLPLITSLVVRYTFNITRRVSEYAKHDTVHLFRIQYMQYGPSLDNSEESKCSTSLFSSLSSHFPTGLCRCSSDSAVARQDSSSELSSNGHLQATRGFLRLRGQIPPLQRHGQSAQISQQVRLSVFIGVSCDYFD